MTTISLRFPVGRYHATPWGRHPNEGEVEWPPSAWRMLRALFAVWKERAPELDAETVEGLLTSLTGPPTYSVPASHAAHSRHYMPTSDHRSDPEGDRRKKLVLDGFVAVDPEESLVVSWPTELDEAQREALRVLLARLTYLGRAESLVHAELIDGGQEDASAGDRQHCKPIVSGQGDLDEEPVELLVPRSGITLEELTVTTAMVQERRLSVPPGAEMTMYEPVQRSETTRTRTVRPEVPAVTAVQWKMHGPVLPPRFGAVAAGHFLRARALRVFGARTDGRHTPTLSGTGEDREPLEQDHAHAHWLAFDLDDDRRLDRLVLWAPGGLDREEIGTVTDLNQVTAPERIDDFHDVRLGLEYAGPASGLSSGIVGPSKVWQSVTPFAPPHHPKRRQQEGEGWLEFVREQVRLCLSWRDLPSASGIELSAHEPWLEYRRYRPTQSLKHARRAVGVRITFPEEVAGPLALGQLSHFGLGLFTPVRSEG